MKKIVRYTFLMLLSGWLATGCTSNFEEYNTDPYAPTESNPNILLPTMVGALMYVQQNDSQMVDQMVGTLGGYFTLSNRWGGMNFDTFNPSDDWNQQTYNLIFQDIYPNLFEIANYTQESGHWWAIASIIRAAAMIRVTDTYGPIPYSQVKDGEMYVPYDSHEDVYTNIFNDLQNAAKTLSDYATQYPSSRPFTNDAIYGGDYAAWARLANSLSLRIAMRTGNEERVKTAIANSVGLIMDNSQSALVNPGVQGNPYLIARGWGELHSNSSIVDYMNGYNDPRRAVYFTKCTYQGYTEQYVGMRAGEAQFTTTEVAGYSMPNVESSTLLPYFVAAETQFLLAEAALKGWTTGNPKDYYEAGIRLSMEQNNVSGDAVTSYINDSSSTPADHTGDPRGGTYNYDRATTVKIAWDAESTDEKHLEQIITQKWIANYPMGIEAWAEYRRTGYPELAPSIDNLSTDGVDTRRGARRLVYPISERDYNTTNYKNAVANFLDGQDTQAKDLFWAKKD